MPGKLLIQSQDGTVQEIPFDRARITIGRKTGNDLHFNRPEISGTHAAFLLENDEFFVSDLGSTNGTMMNGAKLLPHQKYALQNGDLISIAPFRIQFVADDDDTDTVSDVHEMEEARAGSGTMIDINGKVAGGKISTGTEEHQSVPKEASASKADAPPPAAAAPKEEPNPAQPAQPAAAAKPAAPPPPPPKAEAKPAPPPPPAPVAAAKQPDPQINQAEEELPPLQVPKGGTDYLWLGLGALFLLLAIGLIVFLLMQ